MTRRTPSLLALGALVAACSSGGKTSDAPAHLCTPDAFVLCLCADGSHGTKQCAQGGDSFSVCADCSADAPGAGGGAGFGEGGRTGSKGGGGSGGGSGSTGGGGSGSGGGGSGGGTGSTGGSGASSGSGGASSGGASSGGASSGSGGASSGSGGASSGGASSGGASSGNGGTGGNAGPVAGDACPGIAISLTPETDPLVPGTTVGASDDYPSPCAKKAGADVVYAVTASVAGTITVKAQAQAPLWPVLGAWTGACAQGPLAACTDGSAVAGTASLSVSVAAGATAYVVVDSDGAAGPFALSLHLAPGSVCGDGKTESPEQCDDGNTKAGDGCAPDCTVEANPPLADCPGLAWHVWGPTSSVSGATTTYMNFDQGSCGGAKAKDRFYKIVPEASGTLHAKITTASFDAVIYARTGDCIGGAEVACNDTIGLGGDHIDVPVSAGAPLWVAIDGYSTMSGTFTLTVSVD